MYFHNQEMIQRLRWHFKEVTIAEKKLSERIKKETLTKGILGNRLRESNSGFEHYEIYYDKNKIINLSIAIQYYSFDLNNGKRIGLNLFINHQTL